MSSAAIFFFGYAAGAGSVILLLAGVFALASSRPSAPPAPPAERFRFNQGPDRFDGEQITYDEGDQHGIRRMERSRVDKSG